MLQKDVEDYEVAITFAQSGLKKDARCIVNKIKGHFVSWLKKIMHLRA